MDPVFLIMLVVIFGFLFLMMNRNRKQQRNMADMRSNLEVGDEVMTGSGLYGTVTGIDGDVITIESTPGVPTRWLKHAIGKKVDPATEYATSEADASEAEESESDSEDSQSTSSDGFLTEEQMRRPDGGDKKD